MNAYWLSRNGMAAEGPFAESQLLSMWRLGQFAAHDQLCLNQTEDWMKASIVMQGIEEDTERRLREAMPPQQIARVREDLVARSEKPKKTTSSFSLLRVIVLLAILLIIGAAINKRPTHRTISVPAYVEAWAESSVPGWSVVGVGQEKLMDGKNYCVVEVERLGLRTKWFLCIDGGVVSNSWKADDVIELRRKLGIDP